MSRVYDNWEKLIGAVVKREELRRLAYCDSINSSSISSDFSARFSFYSALQDVPAGSTNSGQTFDPADPSNQSIFSSPNTMVIEYKEMKKATKNFRSDLLLGQGAFGRVYKGWINEHSLTASKPGSGIPVAVKKLDTSSFQGHREWLSEINYLGQLRHPNLIKLIGYCIKDDERILVYEFLTKGSLNNHLCTSHLTTKCDVYGFGVVLLELLSGNRAHDTYWLREMQNLVDWGKRYLGDKQNLLRIMDSRLEGQYPQDAAYEVAKLASRCLSSNPERRPGMDEVVVALQQL